MKIDFRSYELSLTGRRKSVLDLEFTEPCEIQEVVCEKVTIESQYNALRHPQHGHRKYKKKVKAVAHVNKPMVKKQVVMRVWNNVPLTRAIIWVAQFATPADQQP